MLALNQARTIGDEVAFLQGNPDKGVGEGLRGSLGYRGKFIRVRDLAKTWFRDIRIIVATKCKSGLRLLSIPGVVLIF